MLSSELSLLCLLFTYCMCNHFDLDIKGEAQYGYYVTIYLGTPPQKINLLIDTGSSNIAIAGVPVNNNFTYFHYEKSRTFNSSEVEISIRYVKGNWAGFIATDIVHLFDDANNSTLELEFACMTSITKIFDDLSQFQGLLGLAYPAIAKPDASVTPFFDAVAKKNNVSNIFSLSLCGPYVTSPQQITLCGKVHLGYSSKEYYFGNIVYTPIIREWYYEIMLTNLKVDTKSITVSCCELNKDKSILDSGTTQLKLPKTVYDWTVEEMKMFTKVKFPAGFWHNQSVGCLENSKDVNLFPTITISLYHTKNSTFSLLVTPELYLLKILGQSGTRTCFTLGIGKSESGTIIGATVLKGFYVIFDRVNKRVGFSNSTHLQNSTNLLGSVLTPVFSSDSYVQCKESETSSSSGFLVLAYVLGCTAVICVIPLLYMLISWIWKHFIVRYNVSSETSSLVDED